jgi:hypothetical protein
MYYHSHYYSGETLYNQGHRHGYRYRGETTYDVGAGG